jgi:hypothetical protein
MRETVFAALMQVFFEDLAIVPPNFGADAGLHDAVALARCEARAYPEISNTAKLQGDRFGR